LHHLHCFLCRTNALQVSLPRASHVDFLENPDVLMVGLCGQGENNGRSARATAEIVIPLWYEAVSGAEQDWAKVLERAEHEVTCLTKATFDYKI
jgi:hypothetical protein